MHGEVRGSAITMSSIAEKAGAIEQDNYSAAKGLAGNGVRVSAIQRPIRGGVTQAMSAQAWEATTVRIPMKWAVSRQGSALSRYSWPATCSVTAPAP